MGSRVFLPIISAIEEYQSKETLFLIGSKKPMRNRKGRIVFNFLISAGRCIGLPLLVSDRPRCRTFCQVLTILKVLLYIFVVITMWQILPEPTLALTYCILNTTGVALSLAVTFQQRRIERAYRALSRTGLLEGCPRSLPLTLLLGLLNTVILIVQIPFYFGRGHNRLFPEPLEAYGLRLDGAWRRAFLNVYRLSAVFVYSTSVSAACVVSLLCMDAFATLWRAVERVRLKPRLGLLRRAASARRRVEDAFSTCVLLSLASALSWFFNSFNLLIVNETVYLSWLVRGFAVVTFVMAMTVFLALAVGGSIVTGEGDALMAALWRRAAVSGPSCDLHLLLRGASSQKMYLTGGGMFVLRKSLILTTLGMVFTYGVLLIQFSSKAQQNLSTSCAFS